MAGVPPVGPAFVGVSLALFGLCVGSFLNVVVFRLPDGRSIVAPRSFCPACRATIGWRDNVPVLSWLLLRGRCRRCSAPIALRYPLVEALTAALFVGAWSVDRGAPAGVLASRLLVVAALLAISFIDFDHRIVPDEISKPMIVLGPLLSFAAPALQTGSWLAGAGSPPERGGALLASIGGAALGTTLLLLVRGAGRRLFARAAARQGGEAMGLGDVKLLAGLGAFTGAQGALLAFGAAAALGAVFGVAHVARLALVVGARRRRRGGAPGHGVFAAARRFGSAIPFAPFLAAGGLAALLVRDPAIGWILGWWPR